MEKVVYFERALLCCQDSMFQIFKLQRLKRDVNPCGAEIGIFRDDYINTMAANSLAPYVSRTSVTMWLTMYDKRLPPPSDFN